jgi:hypothetical protein
MQTKDLVDTYISILVNDPPLIYPSLTLQLQTEREG